MLLVLLHSLTIDEDVVEEDKNELAQVWLEKIIHGSLKSGRCIGKAKRHDDELVIPSVYAKSCFGYIIRIDPNLMRARM